MDTLRAWGSSCLGCWLAGWQLAGWLVVWVLLAGWLAGHGHPRIQRPIPWVVKGRSRGANNNLFESIQDRNKEAYKLQGYKTAGLQGLQGYKLQAYRDYRLLVGKISSTAWWP